MQTELQTTDKQTTQPIQYEIDQNELDLVFNRVISSIGSRAIQEELKDTRSVYEKVTCLVDTVMVPDTVVTGCKFYKESLMADGSFNNKVKTVVLTSYLNLKFLGLHKAQAKKVVLSHQMRAKLSELFDEVSKEEYHSPEKSKVLMFKNVAGSNKTLPNFVQKTPNDFVFLKVILKFPVEQ